MRQTRANWFSRGLHRRFRVTIGGNQPKHLLRAELARVDPSTQKAVDEPARRLEVAALRPEFGATWDDQV
jgi:hypothetical protein